mmetsp:Transcript_9794/g.23946  ORF Transcript_9794/g.23946 Transcript_9794/m.23946 type:complete len:485 (-) Transcript_9794:146-1600(-)
MGFPTEMFVSQPVADHLLCPICHDVFEDPFMLAGCGHSFCKGCLQRQKQAIEAHNALADTDDEDENKDLRDLCCPTCRRTITIPQCKNLSLQHVVHELTVKCNSGDEDSSVDDENSRRVRRRMENGGTLMIPSLNSCTWTGTLQDWINHKKECQFVVTKCPCDGCQWHGKRGDVNNHLLSNMAEHMKTMVDKRVKVVEKKLEGKIQELELTCKSQANQMKRQYVDTFCRQWLTHKPDALQDFVAYKHREYPGALLFGIPGPSRTVWEGGLFPMIMVFKGGAPTSRPPWCCFRAGFPHLNVYPSGTICLSNLTEGEGWKSDHSIPEILFSIQQLLAHPNPFSPCHAEPFHNYAHHPNEYDKAAKAEARKYNTISDFLSTGEEQFLSKANLFQDRLQKFLSNEADRMVEPRGWTLVDDDFDKWKSCGRFVSDQAYHESPSCSTDGKHATESSNQPSESECGCSCCENGQYFWDKRREMRFLFGRGG